MPNETLNGSARLKKEPSASKPSDSPPPPPPEEPPEHLLTSLYNLVETPPPDDPRQGTYVATDTEVEVESDDRSVRLRCTWRELALPNLAAHDYTATWQLPVENETPPYIEVMFDLFLRGLGVLKPGDRVKPYPTLDDAKRAAPLVAERCRDKPCRLTLSLDIHRKFLVAFVHPLIEADATSE